MLEYALKGSRRYWGWLIFLLVVMGIGFSAYLTQFKVGLGITGMSRDVSWGLYVAQFTYLVGIAASGVMVVLPFYLHDYKAFGRITVLGEFLAIAAVLLCVTFVFVDLAYPERILNVMLFPRPNSILFWDMIVLNGYLLLNILVGWNALAAERKGVHYQKWVKVLAYISIPWAFSIHTVTAFLYSGMPARDYWLSAIMAARFLVGAFCSGPAVLILLCLIIRKVSRFDPGKEQMRTLGGIVAYAFILNIFFLLLEVFTAFYSNIPAEKATWIYLYEGMGGHGQFVPWMWLSVVAGVVGLLLLIIPGTRRRLDTLAVGCVAVIVCTWIEKGFTLIPAGLTPNPFDQVFPYYPTVREVVITIGVYALGFFILTVLYKIAISVKEEVGA